MILPPQVIIVLFRPGLYSRFFHRQTPCTCTVSAHPVGTVYLLFGPSSNPHQQGFFKGVQNSHSKEPS